MNTATQTAAPRQPQPPAPPTKREQAVSLIRSSLAAVSDDAPLDFEARDGIGRDLARALKLLCDE